MKLIVTPKNLAAVLTIIVVGLILTHIGTQYLKYISGYRDSLGFLRLFNVDQELSIPSWYSSSTLLLTSIFLVFIGLARKREGDRYALHWLMLSAIFLYLSLDEAAMIHEMAIWPLRKQFPRYTSGYLYYAWVIPGGAVVLVLAVTYLRFLAHLPVKTRYLCLLAGTLYVGGALGIELLGGKYNTLYGMENFTYFLIVAGEEGMEMFGIVVFLYALSSYMASTSIGIHIIIMHDSFPSKDAPPQSLSYRSERRVAHERRSSRFQRQAGS
ncbi:MAG: hypothetical protein ACREJU_09025 [Nitrospiraceae bacterium]